MRVLQLCHRIPYPPADGGTIAMNNMARSLIRQGMKVRILSLNTIKHFIHPASIPTGFRAETKLEAVDVDTSVRIWPAFFNLFTKQSYNITRFYSKAFEQRLGLLLQEEQFDIIQLESLYMTPYLKCIRQHSEARVVLRAHNVEHLIWERLARSEKNIARKKYLQLLAARLKTYEKKHLNELDGLLPITKEDEALFRKLGCHIPMQVTPLGIDLEEYAVNEAETRITNLFHLGSMDWLPNLEGIKWFLENCWPSIHRELPPLTLYLAGRGFPDWLRQPGYPNVTCEGEIADARKYMSDKHIMIVPLLSGSGIRVKIIQGMALGKTIISTAIGAEGIECTDAKDILIADSPGQFLEAVKTCVGDPAYAIQTGKAGRKLVEEKYSNEVIGKQVSLFYKKLAGTS